MVQRKVPSKLGIQAEHDVKSDKRLANLKLYSSQHQDGKSRVADMKKKMKKSRSIKLSDLESLQSSSSPPSRRSFHTPTTTASPQKQQHGSPNYMKPTSSSHAKKELFPVSHKNSTQSGSDFKTLHRKFSNDSEAACVKKPAKKALSRSSSLSHVRTTLTKTTIFKASSSSRKSTRATCSSTLKDSKFPSYLMLGPGGTESEGTSSMKVCPYRYCSLNGHHHADLPPPLKSFVSTRRRLLKAQKRGTKLEALSPFRRPKVLPLETQKEEDYSDVELNVFEAEHACGDELGIDIFIEIYANEKKDAKPTAAEEEMGRIDIRKEIEDQEDNKSTIEDNGIASRVGSKTSLNIRSTLIVASPCISEIDLEEDLKKSIDDVAIEVDTKGSYLQEQNEGDVDEGDHQSIVWPHEEMSMGSYCSDREQDMDDSDSMEWEEEEERLRGFDHDEDADPSVYREDQDNDSKVESSSESSHDVLSVTWLDDILGGYYEDFLVDETLKEANSEEDTSGSNETQEIEYSSKGMVCDQSSFPEETFECLTNAQDSGGENEKHEDDEARCNTKLKNTQCQKMSETCKVEETNEDEYSRSLENNDDESNKVESQIELEDVSEESNITAEDHDLMEKDQHGKDRRFKSKCCIGGEDEEENTSKNWKDAIRRKRDVEDHDEIGKFNPKEPNFLPLDPEPGQEKVDLRHQMVDERKNAEDWMLDCALRQAVTKLAPARKRKVALLVEAFETVMPAAAPKCETRVRNNNAAFGHSGRVQACS